MTITFCNEKLTEAQVDARAALRYTDAEKTKLSGLPDSIDGVTGGHVVAVDNSRVTGFQGIKQWYGTKAQFDAITTKDVSTVYWYPQEE